MARHLFFQPFCVSGFWGLCCADSNKQLGLTCFPVVVPPQGFCFCLLVFFKLFGKFWRFSRLRVSTKFDCPSTSRKKSSVNASLLMGDLFVQPSLESSDLLPQRSREANKMLFVDPRCKDSWVPPQDRHRYPVPAKPAQASTNHGTTGKEDLA